jgi:F420-non-reducing hydrogenase iron-sulfur subunit
MCTGRLDLSFVLRAFSKGVDGVFIGGCHLNECNYITHGNFRALSMSYIGRKLLERLGLNPARLKMELISGAEGGRFAEIMNEYGREIRQFGPLGAGEGMTGDELKFKLEAATKLVPYLRLVERERLRIRFKTEEEYARYFTGPEFDRLFKELIGDELAMTEIAQLLGEGPLSTSQISQNLGFSPSDVSRHMTVASRRRWVKYDTDRKQYCLA